jgi:hypothetical protein
METNHKNAKNAQNILCEYCNVICRTIPVFNKHQTTAKHIRLINANAETNEKHAEVDTPKDPTLSFNCDICKFSTTKQSKPAVEIIGSEDCENYFKYYKAALGGYDKEEDKKFEEKIIKNVLKEVLLNKDAVERKKEG